MRLSFTIRRSLASTKNTLSLVIAEKKTVEVFGYIGVVMHCDEDVKVTLRDVAFVPGVPFDLCSFNVIQEDHVITLDPTEVHMLDGDMLFRTGTFGNYVDATRVAMHDRPPALAAVPVPPQPTPSAQPRPRVSPAVTRSASRQQAPAVTDPL